MDKKNKKIIQSTTQDLMKIIGFDCEVEVVEEGDDDSRVVCDITIKKDANIIIGQGGENLQALQHLARLLVRKKTDEIVKFVLDINSYKKDQEGSVIELAKEMAAQAVSEKKTVVMRPMSAYNRRLVHMLLSENKEVITESVGDDSERRIVIKPASFL